MDGAVFVFACGSVPSLLDASGELGRDGDGDEAGWGITCMHAWTDGGFGTCVSPGEGVGVDCWVAGADGWADGWLDKGKGT